MASHADYDMFMKLYEGLIHKGDALQLGPADNTGQIPANRILLSNFGALIPHWSRYGHTWELTEPIIVSRRRDTTQDARQAHLRQFNSDLLKLQEWVSDLYWYELAQKHIQEVAAHRAEMLAIEDDTSSSPPSSPSSSEMSQ